MKFSSVNNLFFQWPYGTRPKIGTRFIKTKYSTFIFSTKCITTELNIVNFY